VNIHIINRSKEGILSRLANALVDGTGWTMSNSPDSSADLNHFACYLTFAEHFSDWHLTPVSTWFTHKEVGTHYKEFWWELAANKADLRLTSAPMYARMLEQFGPTALVTPAIDRDFFKIAPKPGNEMPRVGVSGFVHPGGRKGEQLVARLAGSLLAHRIELVGTGDGWPIPTLERPFADIPAFYQDLDVFLCTSLIEGIPMPPLEALSCGVPIVIPRGVGLLDELPDDVEGIYCYDAGDFEGMFAAISNALAGRHDADREALRAITEPYTQKAWCKTHADAIAKFLDTGTSIGVESDRHGQRGAFWVAYGEPARKCAMGSISTFRQHNKGIQTALAGESPLGVEDTFIDYPDVDIGGRDAKTMIFDLAPAEWEYIAYFDADTEFIADVSVLYQFVMDGFDMVICKNPDKYHIASKMVRSDNKDECEYTFNQLGTSELIQLNGGVFVFQRNARTARFFRAWHEEWERWGKRDQAALLRALFKNPLKLYVLGNEFNTITRYQSREQSAGILHYPMSARRWRGKIQGRSDSDEAWGAVKKFTAPGSA
jgi:glycosyltransferase involved in cell wall biosynthesis